MPTLSSPLFIISATSIHACKQATYIYIINKNKIDQDNSYLLFIPTYIFHIFKGQLILIYRYVEIKGIYHFESTLLQQGKRERSEALRQRESIQGKPSSWEINGEWIGVVCCAKPPPPLSLFIISWHPIQTCGTLGERNEGKEGCLTHLSIITTYQISHSNL